MLRDVGALGVGPCQCLTNLHPSQPNLDAKESLAGILTIQCALDFSHGVHLLLFGCNRALACEATRRLPPAWTACGVCVCAVFAAVNSRMLTGLCRVARARTADLLDQGTLTVNVSMLQSAYVTYKQTAFVSG